ncbi:Uncharacterised protein [Mycobacteroides abscessus subsp. abscessus]|uniref:nucleotidyltransferase n=1 Tax=Mycobacteroides abscessus TaxID=36809 RepID=UPI0009273B27|nr:nucleotidyltransferase [Mycobacteroides abscessus]SHV15115.1 Uncharacterised protein [Mycobacteroides abscessus subsp. abscessus]SKD11175.1 Uncharacterised protein [Mycobacteroides abscessus subsp. abscessus]SKL37925.1 Uncharacterised protein [Mycobacteroides abscessus subsp. abscessus]SKM28307.1 Uncharacterised protein [Mycobacteroides abscessus subsp. abscessus]
MTNIQSYFTAFVDKISLGQTQVGRIESASNTLGDFLKAQYGLSDAEVFLQGSYANGTAVKPIEGGEYDVDIICVSASQQGSAAGAIQDLYDVLDSNGRYAGKLTQKQPCVRIQYADDAIGSFHVDVVPARASTSAESPLDAPRKSSGWHPTAPNEYTSWCEQQGVHFRQTVQMLKRWRDEHQGVRSAIKSIVLQVLIATHLPQFANNDAERVSQTIVNMNDALQSLDSPPEVWNPVLPSENLASRWTKEAFVDFKHELAEAADLVTKATDAEDLVEQVEYWQDLFGEEFPSVDKDDLYHVELADASHAESPGTRGWYELLDARYHVTVRAWSQLGKRGKRISYPNDGSLLFKGRNIVFKATPTGPTDYSVWWRITNTGEHARRESSLRGNFIRAKQRNGKQSHDPTENWESTSYTGTHLVEVFLVVGTRIVARSAPFKVNIHNPLFRWRR